MFLAAFFDFCTVCTVLVLSNTDTDDCKWLTTVAAVICCAEACRWPIVAAAVISADDSRWPTHAAAVVSADDSGWPIAVAAVVDFEHD